MKANELMVNDWIEYRCHASVYINQIAPYYKVLGIIDGYIKYDRNASTNNEREILPVNLTEEILKTNGFEVIGNDTLAKTIGNVYIAVNLGYYYIYINKYYPTGSDTIHFADNIKVHELQHTLRLYGFNDLADNFKVEFT